MQSRLGGLLFSQHRSQPQKELRGSEVLLCLLFRNSSTFELIMSFILDDDSAIKSEVVSWNVSNEFSLFSFKKDHAVGVLKGSSLCLCVRILAVDDQIVLLKIDKDSA